MSHKALIINEPGGKLKIGTLPRPSLGKGEMLMKTMAVALNPVEWKQIAYNFSIPSYPFVLGADCAGIVEALGEGVSNFKKGDKVSCFFFFLVLSQAKSSLQLDFGRFLLLPKLERIKSMELIKNTPW